MRTLAEMLRRLAVKKQVDDETKDMAAAMVFILRDINAGVDTSAQAWEKRDYWLKADRFRRDWEWVQEAATEVENVVRSGNWEELPRFLMDLFPHFAAIRIKRFTRNPDLWDGAYAQLIERPVER
jgi:hypothetical protein